MKILIVTALVAVGACRAKQEPEAKLVADPGEAENQPEIGYPEGPWWTLDMQSLMVSGSHILIAHRDAKPVHGVISAAAVERSRDEALQRAWRLYRALATDPERFAELAARESDEPVSRASGGALGTLHASALPPAFVDAFGHVREGEVTRPVETDQGFHVLRRLKPSEPSRLDLAHIVVKYEGASGWLRGDRAAEKRTREEARSLAERIAREAKQAPERFASLVRAYSDAEDALREGDMGSLSTYDATETDDAHLFAVAERLPIGGVSEVIALAASGFHIVRRLPPAPRPAFAASIVTVGFADSPLSLLGRPNAARSRGDAEQFARRLTLQLKRHPDQFDTLRAQHCDPPLCEGVTRWTQGRFLVAIEAQIARMQVGQISGEPIETPLGLLLVRREDAASYPPEPPPAPTFAFPMRFLEPGASGS